MILDLLFNHKYLFLNISCILLSIVSKYDNTNDNGDLGNLSQGIIFSFYYSSDNDLGLIGNVNLLILSFLFSL